MRKQKPRTGVKTIAVIHHSQYHNCRFLPYSVFLLKMDLSQTAKLLYRLLLTVPPSHRKTLQDSEGRTYIVYPIAEIAEILDRKQHDNTELPKELDIARALGEKERRDFPRRTAFYVKVPEVVKVSLDMTQRNLNVRSTRKLYIKTKKLYL